MFLVVILILITAPFIWWYLLLQKYKSLDVIPGPKPLPVIGNVLEIGNTPQALFKNALRLMKQHGDIFKIYIGNELKVFIANADFLEQIMSSNAHIAKSDGYFVIKRLIKTGLLTSKGQKWKTRRRMITPTFHFQILEQFLQVFNSSANIFVEQLSKEAGKESVDIHPYVNLFALDVICETAMGVKLSSQEGGNPEFVKSMRGFFDIFIVRFFSPWKKFDTLFRFASEYPQFERYLDFLISFAGNVIKKRRAEKMQEKPENVSSDLGIKRRVALLDMLLESEYNNTLTNADIEEEINTFLVEGIDTTTSGICFALLALADHQEVQQKVYEEIMSVIGDEEYVTLKHHQETKYLEMVVKEVQRFYSSVPFVERRLESNFNMCGIDFPKGTTLTLFLYGVHHNEKYYSEPEKFDPNRFLPENKLQRHNYSFVPFSAGPRNCIGQKFAMLDMKVIIIKILQKFQILPAANYKPELGMAASLKSYNGNYVQLKRRVKNS